MSKKSADDLTREDVMEIQTQAIREGNEELEEDTRIAMTYFDINEREIPIEQAYAALERLSAFDFEGAESNWNRSCDDFGCPFCLTLGCHGGCGMF